MRLRGRRLLLLELDRSQDLPEDEQPAEHDHPETGPEVDVHPGRLVDVGARRHGARDRQGAAVDQEQAADDPADVEGVDAALFLFDLAGHQMKMMFRATISATAPAPSS